MGEVNKRQEGQKEKMGAAYLDTNELRC